MDAILYSTNSKALLVRGADYTRGSVPRIVVVERLLFQQNTYGESSLCPSVQGVHFNQ
jgi:hypothetical protein